MEITEILRRGIVTERSVKLQEQNQYTFEVALRANKIDVRRAVETLASWEASLSRLLPWLGVAALCSLPWLLFVPVVAAACSAILAVLVAVKSPRPN